MRTTLVLSLAVALISMAAWFVALHAQQPAPAESPAGPPPVAAASVPVRASMPSRLLAHALGAIDGKPYLNCREGFLASYARGYRCFETDLLFSSDGALVCLHDGMEQQVGLPKPFTRQQFVSCKLTGRYTGLTADDLLDLMVQKTDWFLITDVKDDNPRALRALLAAARAKGIDIAPRVIPQIYSYSEEALIDEMPFDRWILTIYRMGQLWETARAMVRRQPKIVAFTMPIWWYKPELAQPFQREGVTVFLHTINDPALARKLLGQGYGLYTDSFFE